LDNLEGWLYDRRVATCQIFNPAPTDRIVHLDIDDRSLDAIGKWPWPRAKMARLIDEIAVAKPKAVAIDVVMTDPEPPTPAIKDDGSYVLVDGDSLLANSLKRAGNVIIAASVVPKPTRSASSIEGAVLSELSTDLEINEEQLVERVRTRLGPSTDARQIIQQFLPARREAMFDRIRTALDEKEAPREKLSRQLLPHTDTTLSSPILRVFGEQFDRAMAMRAMRRFSSPLPAKISTLQTVPNLMPLRIFSEAVHGEGFADDNITEPVVRSLPLFVQQDNRLYAQLGFAFACAMEDADLAHVKVSASRIVVPSPKGEIEVPVRGFYSRTLEREVPLVADIPWYGKREWATMFDYPKYEQIKQHFPISTVWDICETRDRLMKNNKEVDDALPGLLGNGLSNEKAEAYVKHPPPLEDAAARMPLVEATLKDLGESNLIEQFASLKDPTKEEAHTRDVLIASRKALIHAQQENPKLVKDLGALRKELADRIAGRGVLVGWTATSAVDLVTTSIHPRCPGVVVHGVIANSIITNNWWTRAPYWVTVLLIITMGMITAVITGRDVPLRASIFTLLLAIGYVLLNGILLFDLGNVIVGAAGPIAAIVIVWAGCTLLRVIVEGLERVRVARDLAVFRHEMQLAQKVQVALIPKSPPKIAGLEPYGWTKPADMTGGDCFDLWELPDGRLGILLADASGHGLAPSMIVSQVRTLVRAMAEMETHPHPIMKRVNDRLAQDLEPGRFITAFLGFLSADGELTWVSAGHGPILWCSKLNGEFGELESTGMPLGIMEPWAADDPSPPLKLETSGMLIVFSDGIFEAPAPGGEQFGVERVQEILKAKSEASAVEIVAAMRDAVTKWQAKDNPADDQTAVVVRKLESGVVVTAVSDKQ
ncbi:MAG TPA: SpoIIE family protein phosphatase, partial [Tepidisphaeraceae bacterium]|nr:SpoIIE family protein phosphatase [Tepidisphaeraceae bacterium]